MAACPDLPREPVSVQLWTVSLHLPTVAARLAAADLEVLLLGDREGPGLRLGRGLEVRTARLPVLWKGTSWRDFSSRGLTELVCGPPSIASSRTHGPKRSGPLATSQLAGERRLRSPAARGVRPGDAALLLLTRRRP